MGREQGESDLNAALADLYSRPGFLFRRAHQIAVSVFLEETSAQGLTPTQYGALVVLQAGRDLDQASLAKLVGMDRSTTALVVSKLAEAGYVERIEDRNDARRRILVITKAGHNVLKRIAEPVRAAVDRLFEPFTASESKQLVALLQKLVEAFNEDTRAPITAPKQ